MKKNCRLLLIVVLLPGSSAWSQTYSPCDLNKDGLINNLDVNLAINMALGINNCTANIEGSLACTVVTVQRIINATQGAACITYQGHATTLNWVASVSSNVAGYNVYRGTTSGGPYTRLNASIVAGTNCMDRAVSANQTYYYVVTSVDVSGNESAYSTQATATIPNP